MNKPRMKHLLAVALGATALSATPTHAQSDEPVQVFIMMGQSNMLEYGSVYGGGEGDLDYAVNTKGLYPYLSDGAGGFTTRSDVRQTYVQGSGDGPASVIRNEFLTPTGSSGRRIGVEMGIGEHVGNAIDAPVLLLKSAIGNRSLGWDLLPPGSERYDYGGNTYAGYGDRDLKWPIGDEPDEGGWRAGIQYDGDVRRAKEVLDNFGTYYPGETSYQVAGFFYWQGDKDRYDEGHAQRYEQNMAQFIKAVRAEFNAPDAPFVLATLGQNETGVATGNDGLIHQAQLAVDGDAGNYAEFAGNVQTVYTHPLSLGGASNSHYNGHAETYMNVGEAMGQEMAGIFEYRPFLQVDRASGEMKIVNPFYGNASQHSDIDLTDYEITSDAGALVGANWTSFAQAYDADSGGAVDSDDNWLETATGVTSLSEAAAGGDGGSISFDNQISLGNGAWLVNPEEDIQFVYTDANGVERALSVVYVGDQIKPGDYDLNGVVESADFAAFMAGAQTDMSALSRAQAYAMGDLDGDGDNDIYDFALFREAFEQDNLAPGAFEAMVAAYVPEPGSLLLLGGGVLLLGSRRRRSQPTARRKAGQRPAASAGRAAVFSTATLLTAASASAQTNTVFAEDFETPDVTAYDQGNVPDGWVDANQGFGSGRNGLTDKQTGDFSAPDPNHQAFAFRYTNSGITTALGQIGSLNFGETYAISFDVVRDDGKNAGTPYAAQLIAFDPLDARNDARSIPGNSLLLASTSGNAESDGSFSTIGFNYTQGTVSDDAYLGYDLGLRFRGASTSALIDNVRVDVTEANDALFMKLQVDTTTGDMALVGGTNATANTINYYQITSAANSLAPDNWISLQDQDFEDNGPSVVYGDGWVEAAGSSSQSLAEGYLLDNSTVGDGEEVSLGNAYDTATDAQDLAFTYSIADGTIFEGQVEYIQSLLLGDLNGDAQITNGDIAPFVLALTDPDAYSSTYGLDADALGDLNGDGSLTNGDIAPFVALLTGASQESETLTAVPEPASLSLLTLGGLALLRRRRNA